MAAPRSGPRSTARSLADDVRSRDDESLVHLLVARPDLARPAPADLTSLAARASTRASVQRALDRLDRGQLQVLEAAVVAGSPVAPEAVAALLEASPEDVSPVLDGLWALALLWHAPDGRYVVRTVSEALGGHVAGLGPTVAELRGSTPATHAGAVSLDALLAGVPPRVRALLDRLTWGPPTGTLEAEGPLAHDAQWLLDRQLLLNSGPREVTLPREVALRLRGGRLHRQAALRPPRLPVVDRGAAAVDAVSGGQASDLLVLVEELAAAWGAQPPRVLRSGGLAVRDLRRLGGSLDVAEDQAAFVVELAFVAGLVADDGGLEPVWAPTPRYDDWSRGRPATRWALLADAWLGSGRAPSLVGTTPTGAASPVNALSSDVLWPVVRQVRGDVLAELRAIAAGCAPDPDTLVDRVRWRRPLRSVSLVRGLTVAELREAEWLGVTGSGALSSAGRRLLESTDVVSEDRSVGQARTAGVGMVALDAAAAEMAPHLPPPVEQVLVQADLTAVAPGRLEGDVAELMRLVADVESRGGATVFRFSAGSVRRAFDAGWSSSALLERLRAASRTPIPQPLEYLVGDVARQHGQARVGAAAAYVRSEDAAALDAMMSDRTLTGLRLRRLAPTVLVSPAGPEAVLGLLRDGGYAPMTESGGGVVVVPQTAHHRTPTRRAPVPPTVSSVDEPLGRELVARLRDGELSSAARQPDLAGRDGPPLPATDPIVTLSVLRDAAAEGQGVWVGYVDGDGDTTRLLFFPKRVEGGRAAGTIGSAHTESTLSVSRITGAVGA